MNQRVQDALYNPVRDAIVYDLFLYGHGFVEDELLPAHVYPDEVLYDQLMDLCQTTFNPIITNSVIDELLMKQLDEGKEMSHLLSGLFGYDSGTPVWVIEYTLTLRPQWLETIQTWMEDNRE